MISTNIYNYFVVYRYILYSKDFLKIITDYTKQEYNDVVEIKLLSVLVLRFKIIEIIM